MMRALILFFSLSLLIPQAFAHKPSDSYLFLNVKQNEVLGQWDIALRDLDFAIGLDANGDGNITWGELRAKQGEVAAYALAHFKLAADGVDCPLRATDQLVDNHSDGAYAVLKFSAACKKSPATLVAGYTLFSDLDPQHKGLLRLEYRGATTTAIFSPDKSRQQFKLLARRCGAKPAVRALMTQYAGARVVPAVRLRRVIAPKCYQVDSC